MRMKVAFVIALMLVPSAVLAQTDSLGDLSGRLRKNTKLFVYDDLQHVRQVFLTDVTPDGLTAEEYEGRYGRKRVAVTIPAGQIRRIEEERNDGIGRGLGIGLAVGGGLALVGALGCRDVYGYEGTDCAAAGILVYLVPGVAIGGLIDWAIKERVTIYESPRAGGRTPAQLTVGPLVTRRAAGAQLSVRF